jgi:hypothetical protein
VPLSPTHSKSGKLGTVDRATSTTASSTSSTTTTTANTAAKFFQLNNDIDHDNINLLDFIYGDYITNGIIDHDYNALTPGYIDLNNKSYHLTSGLCSSQIVRFTADPTAGGVRVYHVLARLGSLNIVMLFYLY